MSSIFDLDQIINILIKSEAIPVETTAVVGTAHSLFPMLESIIKPCHSKWKRGDNFGIMLDRVTYPCIEVDS